MGKKKIILGTLIFMLLLPGIARAGSIGSNRNLFYVEVLNYSFPLAKTLSFNEEDMAENSFSLYGMLLALSGVDIKRPLDLVGKEASYLQAFNESEEGYDIEYFKLDDKNIAKEGVGTQEINNINVVNPDLKKKLNTSKPEVLIYHTHTTEGYAVDSTGKGNVTSVGDELVKELQNNYGIYAIDDKTVHDATAYTQSYARSSVTLDKYIKSQGDFKLVIDLHRDSVSNKNSVTLKINGESTAKIMMVMSKKNPHFNTNMAMANKLIQNSDKLFPGFCKGVCYYNYGTRYFNQDKSKNAVLIEVGADINTISEAKASAKYLARIIAESLK